VRKLVGGASAVSRASRTRGLSTTNSQKAVTPFKMPAMSPTMTEGGIASWKVQPGQSFSTGDIILEVETDKATMDVEAQDDGIMGKIVHPDGSKNIPVGKIIAMLAEEGDDISNIELPSEQPSASAAPATEESKPSSSTASHPAPPSPSASDAPIKVIHNRPLFPSVVRLLQENGISDAKKIKGTGIRGMLTKGDVLAHLGLASNPMGTAKQAKPASSPAAPPPAAPKNAENVYDAGTVRSLILSGLAKSTSTVASPPSSALSFDDIVVGYLPAKSPAVSSTPPPPPVTPAKPSYFHGLI